MITAVIIDDEQNSRITITAFLKDNCPQINIAGYAPNVQDARALINEIKPQLVFLDIEMPYGSGFDLLLSLPSIDFEIIFVTAYNEYALNAFHFSATDYLLKPLRIEQLVAAVQKAEERIIGKSYRERYKLLMQNLAEKDAARQKIALTWKGEHYIVQPAEIMYITADTKYTRVHIQGKFFLTSKSLKEFEDMLPRDMFCRIHHSHIVNIRFVKKITKGRGGSVLMQDGSELEISVRRKDDFMKLFLKCG